MLMRIRKGQSTVEYAALLAIVIGAVTLFAYLLGVTILFLDILYVLVDPRVSLGSKART